jgi:hypothetical protein
MLSDYMLTTPDQHTRAAKRTSMEERVACLFPLPAAGQDKRKSEFQSVRQVFLQGMLQCVLAPATRASHEDDECALVELLVRFGPHYDQLCAGLHIEVSPPKAKGHSKGRGSVQSSTKVLAAWYKAHKDDPYPKPEDKEALGARAGMTYKEVGQWFTQERRLQGFCKQSKTTAKRGRMEVASATATTITLRKLGGRKRKASEMATSPVLTVATGDLDAKGDISTIALEDDHEDEHHASRKRVRTAPIEISSDDNEDDYDTGDEDDVFDLLPMTHADASTPVLRAMVVGQPGVLSGCDTPKWSPMPVVLKVPSSSCSAALKTHAFAFSVHGLYSPSPRLASCMALTPSMRLTTPRMGVPFTPSTFLWTAVPSPNPQRV